jgi:hypothetical protein
LGEGNSTKAAEKKEPNMLIIGCDLHTRYQNVAMADTETGEIVEQHLQHENGEARAFYASTPMPAGKTPTR